MDIRDQFDALLNAVNRISLIESLCAKLTEAASIDRRECGNCDFWMKSRECPREHNVNGFSRGPSMSAPACSKYLVKPWVVELKLKRLNEAVAFAQEHGLPIPAALIRGDHVNG
jgi:hypothetical protein